MRKIQKYRYVFAAVITVIIFMSGILFSNLMDNQRYSSLQAEFREDQVQLESRQLQVDYLRSSEVQSCEVLQEGLRSVIEGYNKRLDQVRGFQKRTLLQTERFSDIKHKFVLSGIRYWMFAEDLRSRCGYEANTVLFFTKELYVEECEECENMGKELSKLKEKYDGKILIFSVPSTLDDGSIEILEKQFNVTKTPSVVINSNKTLKGYHSKSEIRKWLDLGNETG